MASEGRFPAAGGGGGTKYVANKAERRYGLHEYGGPVCSLSNPSPSPPPLPLPWASIPRYHSRPKLAVGLQIQEDLERRVSAEREAYQVAAELLLEVASVEDLRHAVSACDSDCAVVRVSHCNGHVVCEATRLVPPNYLFPSPARSCMRS